MKFSLSLLQSLVPGITKKEIIETLNLVTCEAEDAGERTIDISIPANRFSDLASHRGIAQEIAAGTGRARAKKISEKPFAPTRTKKAFSIKIEEPKKATRYAGAYMTGVKVGPSPKWLKDILYEAGIRSINNVVDIMNYVMIEGGQPLHAFDYDKLTKTGTKGNSQATIVVRCARKGEKIATLDEKHYTLDESMLVIADVSHALAIAGIKGGVHAEVHNATRAIIIEAAHFEGSGIYETSRALQLVTDASMRFAHQISPALVEPGIMRAIGLIQEFAKGELQELQLQGGKKELPKVMEIEADEWNKALGVELDAPKAQKLLTALGYTVKVPAKKISRYPITRLRIEVPVVRTDIETHEDIIEEIARLYGLNAIKPQAPRVHLMPGGEENAIIVKDKAREIIKGFGIDEVYNYSFVGKGGRTDHMAELQNPIAEDKQYLRANLGAMLMNNIKNNLRFMDEIKLFEIGNVWKKGEKGIEEYAHIGIVRASRNQEKKELFLEVKGIADAWLKKMGLAQFTIVEGAGMPEPHLEPHHAMRIESGATVLGTLGLIEPGSIENTAGALIEIDLSTLETLLEERHEYKPLSKYPSIMRDISILIAPPEKIGDIIQAIQDTDPEYIERVDLIDEYRESVTFRIVFQADNRTLTDQEVNGTMKRITETLQSRFKAQIR